MNIIFYHKIEDLNICTNFSQNTLCNDHESIESSYNTKYNILSNSLLHIHTNIKSEVYELLITTESITV